MAEGPQITFFQSQAENMKLRQKLNSLVQFGGLQQAALSNEPSCSVQLGGCFFLITCSYFDAIYFFRLHQLCLFIHFHSLHSFAWFVFEIRIIFKECFLLGMRNFQGWSVITELLPGNGHFFAFCLYALDSGAIVKTNWPNWPLQEDASAMKLQPCYN